MDRKVKIIRVSDNFCYECGSDPVFYPATTDWETVTNEEYFKLREIVLWANKNLKRSDDKFILLSYDNTEEVAVTTLASQWRDKVEKRKKAAAKKEAEAKAKRKAAALERKKTQLEKLKKELESEYSK